MPLLKKIIGVNAARQMSVHEDWANILVAVFGRKTSIVFDMTSLCDLFATCPDDRQLLANTMFLALATIKQNAPHAEIFKKYQELAIAQLKLSTINEMV
jgi:hypothetical protein